MYLVVGPLMTVAQILLGHVSAGHQHQVWNFVMNWDKPIVSWVQGQSLCKLALKDVLAWEIWFRSLLFHSRIRTAALIWYSNNRSSQYRNNTCLSPPFIVRPPVVFKVVANMLSVMLCSSHSHWFFRTTSLKYWMMQSWHLMFLEPRRHKKVRERSANFRTLSPLSFEVNFSQLPTRCILTKKPGLRDKCSTRSLRSHSSYAQSLPIFRRVFIEFLVSMPIVSGMLSSRVPRSEPLSSLPCLNPQTCTN